LGILLSSILCICPNQHNLFNLIVSVIMGFKLLHKLLYCLIFFNFLFSLYAGPKIRLYTFLSKMCVCLLSLLVSRFLMYVLKFCLLLCSVVCILVFLRYIFISKSFVA
jgi:hypothetical protein